jgi:hypothetical protein
MPAMEQILKTVDQKTVIFYDDELVAIRADDGQVYVSLRHLCDSLGITRQPQVRRIKENHVLAKGYAGGIIMVPPGERGGGGRQQAGVLRVDLVPLWLSGIDTKRVKDDIRKKLEKYQEEVAKVLWEAFQEGRLTATPSFDDLLKKDSPAVSAYKQALAIVELARNQILIEARLDDYGERLERVESLLGDTGRAVTPDQASQISQAVKAVAIALNKQTKKNEFGAVYGELYRKYGITSYKLLPAQQFEVVMKWLSEWYQSLTNGEELPF